MSSGLGPTLALAEAIRRLGNRLRPRSPEAYNERVIYTEVIFQAIASAGAMSFIAIFLIRLGAPNWLVGLYSSLPALVMMLAVLPMGAFVQRQRSLVRAICGARLIFRSFVASFALLPFLPAAISPFVLVAARCVMNIPGAVLNVANTTMWGQVTAPRRRPRMLSTRMAVQGTIGAIIGLLAGQWLDRVPFPLNYQILFLTALAACVGSVLTLRRLKLPKVTEEEIRERPRLSLAGIVPLLKRTPRFRSFSLAAFVFRLGMALPSALFSIYRVRTLGASDAWIGVLLTVERLVSVVAYVALGRLLSRPKYRRWLWVSAVGAALFPLSMAMVRTAEMLVIPSAIVGLFSAGVNIFLTTTLLQVSPEDQRPMFVAMNSLLANVTAFIAPILGTLLADATSIQLALVAAAGVRMVGGMTFWRLGVGSERRDSDRTVAGPAMPGSKPEGYTSN